MKRIRVLHLRDTNVLCGPGKTILESIRLNPDDDIEYEVGAFEVTGGNEYLRTVQPYAPTLSLPASKTRLLGTARLLASRVRERGYDLVHPHDFKTRALCALAARHVEWPPELTTIHGLIDVGWKGTLYNRIDVNFIRRSARVFMVSEAMRALIAKWRLDPARVDVVRNRIVLDRYPFDERDEAVRRELGWTDARFVIGCVGRLSAEKGQEALIRTFHGLPAELDWGLVLAGDGPDRERLERLARQGPASDRIALLGHRRDVRAVYGTLDLLVLNSFTEGLPNVVLEAMALGVPVVATAVGGTPECIPDRDVGWLIPPGNERALRDALLEAGASGAERERRRRGARARVEREFDMHGLVRQTHTIYRQLLQRETVA